MSYQVPESLLASVSDILGAETVSSTMVSGGDISSACCLELSSGDRVFLKWSTQAPADMFLAEADGLKRLADVSGVRVPQVLGLSTKDSKQCFLLLEFLEGGPPDEASFGKMLASLHRKKAERYGLERDNFIGRLPQVNCSTPTSSWGEFFYEYRLLVQASLGQKVGWCKEGFMITLLSKRQQIVELLAEVEETPSLLHGDLWSGNVLWTTGGPALIDPAVYYGHREADLAFLELFGSPGPEFYRSYQAEFPPIKGFLKRKEVLNLYHLMTHSSLFGGTYPAAANRALDAL